MTVTLRPDELAALAGGLHYRALRSFGDVISSSRALERRVRRFRRHRKVCALSRVCVDGPRTRARRRLKPSVVVNERTRARGRDGTRPFKAWACDPPGKPQGHISQAYHHG